VTPEEQWTLMADPAPDAAPENEVPAIQREGDAVAVEGSATDTAAPEVAEADVSKPVIPTPHGEDPVTDEPAGKDSVAADSVGDDGTDAPPRRWWAGSRARRAGVLLLIVVAVAAIALAAALGWKLQQRNAVDAASDQAEQAARNYAVALTSVSSDNLDQNFADVLGGATGEFKDMYSQSSGQLRQLLVDNKAKAQGTVIDSGIKSASTSEVVVLLFVDQTVTNTATPDPRVDRSRVVMTMEKVDGRWLAAKVDLP
jgi:Mce-associated membrane protein